MNLGVKYLLGGWLIISAFAPSTVALALSTVSANSAWYLFPVSLNPQGSGQYLNGNLEPVVNAQGTTVGYMNQVWDSSGKIVDWVYIPMSQFGGASGGQTIDTSHVWQTSSDPNVAPTTRVAEGGGGATPEAGKIETVFNTSGTPQEQLNPTFDTSGNFVTFNPANPASLNNPGAIGGTNANNVTQMYNPANPATYNTTQLQQPQTTLSNGQLGYTPLEPVSNTITQYGTSAGLSSYLSSLYTLAVTIGGLLAVALLVVGGVRYMLSEAFTDIDKAKRQMRSALWGLLVILGSFLILYTINPTLLRFNLDIPRPNQQPSSTFAPVTGGLNLGGSGGGGNLVNNSALTDAQYKSLDDALNPLSQQITGTKTLAVGAYPTTDPINDPNVKTFIQQCESSSAGIIAAGSLVAYFISTPLAVTGLMVAGAQPIKTVQAVPGDQVGFSSGTTVETCVMDISNN